MPAFDESDLHAVYGERIPSSVITAMNSVKNVLSDRLDKIERVKFHANFSVDEDTAIALNAPLITKGVLVVAAHDMPLKQEDMAWLPAQMYRGRTVFEIPSDKSVDLSAPLKTLNASIGTYETRYVDDIGIDHNDRFLVVDHAPDAQIRPLQEQWLVSGVTIGEAYDQLTNMSMGGKTLVEHGRSQRTELAKEIIGTATAIYNDEMHGLYSDQQHVYVANGLVKQEGHVLQRVSALGGFVEIQNPQKRFVPADHPVSLAGFEGWSNMSQRHLRRIYNDCSWDEKEAFNTQVLAAPQWNADQRKKAIDLYGNSANSTPWHMKKAKFSSQGVRDMLPADLLLKLTPEEVPSFAPAGARAGDTLSIPIDPSYSIFKKLMSNPSAWGQWKPFNDAVLDGSYLKVPRSIINTM